MEGAIRHGCWPFGKELLCPLCLRLDRDRHRVSCAGGCSCTHCPSTAGSLHHCTCKYGARYGIQTIAHGCLGTQACARLSAASASAAGSQYCQLASLGQTTPTNRDQTRQTQHNATPCPIDFQLFPLFSIKPYATPIFPPQKPFDHCPLTSFSPTSIWTLKKKKR